jgi:glycosyltransferase involved in cell wall biosynthesis
MANDRTLIVEGWRFLPHSYALVNHSQLLELLRVPGLRVLHRDMPFVRPDWKETTGLHDPIDEEVIRAIPTAGPDTRADAVLRITFPYDCSPSRVAPRTCVFGTSEFGCIPDNYLTGGQTLRQAMADPTVQIITPSQWSKAGFIQGGAEHERVSVVPHGVDSRVFHPLGPTDREALRMGFGIEGFTFLCIGSMTANKGLPTLLRAFAQLSLEYPDIQLVMKGLDALYPSLDLLQQQAAGLTEAEFQRVQDRLIYLGQTLNVADMARLYQAADVYVAPYSAEGFNLPVLEAAACGTAVICTAGGPTDDFTDPQFALPIRSTRTATVQAGANGWMLQPDPAHLLEQMRAARETPAFCQNARLSAPGWIRSRFSWRTATVRLLAVLFPEIPLEEWERHDTPAE